MKPKSMSVILLCGLLLGSLPAKALAQGNPGGGFGGGPGGGQFDPTQIRQMIQQYQQRMLDDIKTRMGSSDDEFAVLSPKIQNIIQLQTATVASRFGARGMAFLNAGQSPTPLQTATSELQAAVDDPTTNDQIIANKLAAVRAEKQKVQDQLTAAQADLVQLLTQKQEAVLVMMGLLQ
jgi:Spy/CpxP family protein refolding chaperone